MKIKMLSALLLAATVCLAPAAFAEDMKVEKETSLTLSNGKKMKVMIVKMHDQMMAIVPVDQLEDLLSRAEGHSMSIN